MKAIPIILVAATAVLITGCVVTSVYPFYTAKDLTFEPALVGRWTKTDDAGEHWNFQADGTNAYRLTYSSGDKTNLVEARLFKLGEQRFFDMYAAEDKCEIQPPPIPSHLLLRVFRVTPTPRMAALNHDWLREFVQKEPKSIRHEVLKTGPKPEDVRVVLTADTPELQKFILGHLKTEAAWTEAFELKRD